MLSCMFFFQRQMTKYVLTSIFDLSYIHQSWMTEYVGKCTLVNITVDFVIFVHQKVNDQNVSI